VTKIGTYLMRATIGGSIAIAVLVLGSTRAPQIRDDELLHAIMSGFIGGAMGGIAFERLREWRDRPGEAGLFGSWIVATTITVLVLGVVPYVFGGDVEALREAALAAVPMGFVVGGSIALFVHLVKRRP